MMIHEQQQKMSQDNHLQLLKEKIIRGWPKNKGHMAQTVTTLDVLDDMEVIDSHSERQACSNTQKITKSSMIMTPYNHMGIEKKTTFTPELIYWTGMNKNIEIYIIKLLYPKAFIFSEYGLSKKIMSDTSGNFMSDKF